MYPSDELRGDDLKNLGFGGTAMPAYSLNLAGADGFPSPEELMHPALDDFTTDMYGEPDRSKPPLDWGDTGPGDVGMRFMPELAADPSLPDLKAGALPDAVDLPDGLVVPPQIAGDVPSAADLEAGNFAGLGFDRLQVIDGVNQDDPLMPDFQHPVVQPQMMQGRPGDPDPGAQAALHAQELAQQVGKKQYGTVFMDASGVNSHRARKFVQLMIGWNDAKQ